MTNQVFVESMVGQVFETPFSKHAGLRTEPSSFTPVSTVLSMHPESLSSCTLHIAQDPGEEILDIHSESSPRCITSRYCKALIHQKNRRGYTGIVQPSLSWCLMRLSKYYTPGGMVGYAL